MPLSNSIAAFFMSAYSEREPFIELLLAAHVARLLSVGQTG
jgi:hypothetical protein